MDDVILESNGLDARDAPEERRPCAVHRDAFAHWRKARMADTQRLERLAFDIVDRNR